MVLSGRTLLLILSIIVVAVAVVIVVEPNARWLAIVIAACGVVSILVLNIIRPPTPQNDAGPSESDNMASVSEQRRDELIRGTSMYLREMQYRYSIRTLTGDAGERRCFSAEVNTVQLGFIPAIIIDNTNDRQGYGYVAFVHDGERWRGPGLPCPDGQTEAVRHAARCVSPLATEEETSMSSLQ